MTTWFIYLSYIAALNPARLREALPEERGRSRAVPLVGGAAVVLLAGLALAAASESILDALDITPETWRIAAGTVVALVAIRVLVVPGRPAEPELTGPWASIVPVAFPLLLTPELVALISVYGATESLGTTVAALAVALAVSVAAGLLRRTRPRLWIATTRLLASGAVVAGFALIVEGIRDV